MTISKKFDAVIVGAGPAGSATAIRLALTGRSVLLVDKAAFPRHKLCGEFVSPECLDHLDELGVSLDVAELKPSEITKTVFYNSKGRSFAIDNTWLGKNGQHAIGLSRMALDMALMNRASEVGVTVRTQASVNDIRVTSKGSIDLVVNTGNNKYSINAGLIVDATGRGRYVARQFDGPTAPIKATQVAFKAHVTGSRIEAGASEIYSFRGGYGGCNAVEGGVSNLCFLIDAGAVKRIGNNPQQILEEVVFSNRRAADVLSEITAATEWLSVPVARYGALDPAPAPGVLAAGDAAAFIDPFTGSGIALALQSSELVRKAITESNDLVAIGHTYRRSHEAEFGRRLGICRALRFLSSSPRLADTIIAALSTSVPLRRSFAKGTRTNPSKTALDRRKFGY